LRYLSVLDGLLLSGGVDVAPAHYGEEPHPELGNVDTDRDVTELALLQEALAQDMPLFAICRGIQMLNVALGEPSTRICRSVSRGARTSAGEAEPARSAMCHSIQVAPETRLSEIVGAGEMQTNSFHHQALNRVGEVLRVTARAADGVIEAVERPASRYLIGVQFHPEETALTIANRVGCSRHFYRRYSALPPTRQKSPPFL